MDDRATLLRAVLESPWDDVPRLAYADWLDEHGRGDLAEFIRAEFIRVQCELAGRFPDGQPLCECITGPAHDGCPLHRYERLRERQRELWRRLPTAAVFAPWASGIATDPDTPRFWVGDETGSRAEFLVRRGFVAVVGCDLWTFCGGSCPGCIEPGELDDGDRRCRLCRGTGRTPGIAADLFRSQPVVSVRLTVRQPQDYHNNDDTFREGRLYGWYKGVHPSGDSMSYDVPDDLWEFVARQPGCVVHGNWADFKSRALALAALGAAAVDFGRAAAGLSPLHPSASR